LQYDSFEINHTKDIFETKEYHLPTINTFKFLVKRAVSNFYRFTIRIVVTFDYDPNERKFKLVKTDKKNTIDIIEKAISFDSKLSDFISKK